MPDTALVVIVIALLAVVAAVAWHVLDLTWARRTALRRRVLVNVDGSKAMRGILWQRRGRLVVLRDVVLIEPGAQPVDLDGDVVIDRDRIEWVQVP